MKTVAVMALQDGMQLAEDINVGGKKKKKKGTKVDHIVKAKLEAFKLLTVQILDEEDLAETYYEKLKVSEAFKLFKSKYTASLAAYKVAVDSFIIKKIPFRFQDLKTIADTLCPDNISGKINLPAAVIDPSDVHQRGRETGHHGNRDILEEVLGIPREVFDGSAQASAQERKVHADVDGCIGFPGQGIIDRGDHGSARIAHIRAPVGHQIHIPVIVGRKGSVDSVRSAKPEKVQSADILKESFPGQVPCSGNGPEVAPAGLRTEF